MKKKIITPSFFTTPVLLLICFLFAIYPYFTTLHATNISEDTQLLALQKEIAVLNTQLDTLSSNFATYAKSMNALEKRLSDVEVQNDSLQNLLVDYYINKLNDPTYVATYSEDTTYYIAAESLGQLGKVAIPSLIERLDTTDDYERALALYSLLLASQSESVQAFCGNDYIHTSLDFDARNHPKQIEAVKAWWEKYESHF